MKKNQPFKPFIFLVFILFSVMLHAQNGAIKGRWYLQPSAFFFDLGVSSSTTRIANEGLPGENLSFSNSTVPGVGVGYFISPNLSVFTVIAYPPTTTVEGTNNLAGITAADVTYAPFGLLGIYHFKFGSFEPFIGGGIAYAAILDVDDIDVVEVEAENAFGFMFRAGLDYMINEKWGTVLSVNKQFIDTEITGNALGAPAEVDVSLDPWVYSLGITYRLLK